jgi:4-hydroxy-2-oxoheptanedioate aldolase
MSAAVNDFKKRLKTGKTQFGIWSSLSSEMVTELLATTDIDWICVDGEHSPNQLTEMRRQLLSIDHSGTNAMVRVPYSEDWMIKQALDIGAQTVLVPMVETPEQAEQIVRAMLYPPHGIRGVGSYGTRASKFGTVKNYLTTANDQVCLIVQVENMKGIENLDAILAVDGIDAVFIGPSDLSADMGFLGQPERAEVQVVINTALEKIIASDKAAGILTFNMDLAKQQVEMGVDFIAVGMDVALLGNAARALVSQVGEF